MSRKEKTDALRILLEMTRRHEGEWSEDKIIAEFCLRLGYAKKTAKGYLDELVEAGKVKRGELGVYLEESKERTREEQGE